jgi:hypothetical protein
MTTLSDSGKTKSKKIETFFGALPAGKPETVIAGKNFFLREANTALRRELGEQIDAREIDPTDDKWFSRVQMRALEMIQDVEELAPSIVFSIQLEIEQQASYSFLGYQSFIEWVANSRLRAGGMYSDHRIWINKIIPKLKAVGVFTDDTKAEAFCLTAVNDRGHSVSDGPSRHAAMRMATSDLHFLCNQHTEDLAAAHQLPPEKRRAKIKQLNQDLKLVLTGYINLIGRNDMTNTEKAEALNSLRQGYRPERGKFHTFSEDGTAIMVGTFNKDQYASVRKLLNNKVVWQEHTTNFVSDLLRLTTL